MALAALLTLALQWGYQPAPAGISEVGELAETERRQRRIPDLSVVVLRGDDELLAQGYGRAELGRTDPVTARTVFQLGSISKQFLAALVVALAADGTLSLDDPAVQHLPDFPRLPPDLRVRHLLEHTSGVRELFTLPESETAYHDLSRSREELAEAVRYAPVDFPPGSRWSYSNTNYTLLAFLVERLTSRPYERALAERFFEPLGLSSLRQCRRPCPLVSPAQQRSGAVRRRIPADDRSGAADRRRARALRIRALAGAGRAGVQGIGHTLRRTRSRKENTG